MALLLMQEKGYKNIGWQWNTDKKKQELCEGRKGDFVEEKLRNLED